MPLEDAVFRELRHDIRGQMNALQMNVGAIGLYARDAERLQCLDAIERAADSVSELVDKLVALPDEKPA